MGNIRNEPGSIGKHIFRINNTRADLIANLGTCQDAIETDTLLRGYKDHNGDYHWQPAEVDGVVQISSIFGLKEITEDGTQRLAIYKMVGATWIDTGNRLA